jgi:hypothetical protein
LKQREGAAAALAHFGQLQPRLLHRLAAATKATPTRQAKVRRADDMAPNQRQSLCNLHATFAAAGFQLLLDRRYNPRHVLIGHGSPIECPNKLDQNTVDELARWRDFVEARLSMPAGKPAALRWDETLIIVILRDKLLGALERKGMALPDQLASQLSPRTRFAP